MKIKFEPRDCWIGVYWDIETWTAHENINRYWIARELVIYLCIIPLLPIIFTIPLPNKEVPEEYEVFCG